MPELILLIIALLCLFNSAEAGAFFLMLAVAVVAWKRVRQQKEFEEVHKTLTEQADSLRKELAVTRDTVEKLSARMSELKAGMTVAAQPVPGVRNEAAPAIIVPETREAPRVVAPAEVKAPETAPISPKPASPVPAEKTAQPKVPEPIAPVAPAAPIVTPRPGQTPPTTTPAIPRPEVPALPKPVEPRPQVAASVPAPPPPAYRAPSIIQDAPKATKQQKLSKALDLEQKLGSNWLNTIGVILVVLGVASFGIYEFSEFGAMGKVLILLAVGAAMLGGGIFAEVKDRYRFIGRTAIGGGWAVLFFVSYGMNHIDAMRVINSEMADLLLMLGISIAMALHTLRYRSQLVTGLAFLLAFSTITMTQDTVYALSAGAVLALGLVIITNRMKWYELEVFGILSSYLNHFYWLYKVLGPEGSHHQMFPQFYPSAAILVFYWLVFRVAYVAHTPENREQENIATVSALLNPILLLAVMKFQSVHPEMAFFALLGLGALEFCFGQLPITRRRRPAFVLLSVVGAALMVMAVPFRYSGESVSVFWLIGAEMFLIAGVLLNEVVFRRIGMFAALLVGGHVLFVDVRQLIAVRQSAEFPFITSGILMLSCGLIYYLNAHLARIKWASQFEESVDVAVLTLHSYLGAITFGFGLWALAPHDYTAVAWAGMMLVLAFASGRLLTDDLFIQSVIMGMLVTLRTAMVNLDYYNAAPPHHPHRYLLMPVIAAAIYGSSALLTFKPKEQQWARALLTWFGTATLAALIAVEIPEYWIPVGWMALGIMLACVAPWRKLAHLSYQQQVLSALAVFIVVFDNLPMCFTSGPLVVRIVPVMLVAAGLYGISRRSAYFFGGSGKVVSYLHTWAATGILVALGWSQIHGDVLAVAIVGFAVALALASRWLPLEEFPMQAHVLAAITVLRTVSINLESTEKLHGLSERLLTTVAVAGALYTMSRVVPFKKEHRDNELHHAYTWVASALVATLMWYELQPISVAVGWALFGLVLFEIGTLRHVRQLRFQGYVALVSSFVRIFFVNLMAAAAPGETLSPRLTTIVPIALIMFFVYSQMAFGEEDDKPSRFDVASIIAYLGSATFVALIFFQMSPQWVVTWWAGFVVVLLSVALLLDREVFLQQAVLLSVGILVRGAMHNLFGDSYFTGSDWTGRFVHLGSAIAVLFASLPLAFRAKNRYLPQPKDGFVRRTLRLISSRPEQVLFFVPVVLLTIMLTLKMRAGMVTVAWGIEGVAIFLLALTVGERSFRLTGLSLLLLCVGKVIVVDAWRLALRDRFITFIILGLALSGVSFLYTRYREAIRQYL